MIFLIAKIKRFLYQRLFINLSSYFFSGWEDILVSGIYHGPKKPKDVNQYLKAFRDNVVNLKATGIPFEEGTVHVAVKGIVCDAPATTFLKNIMTHDAYYGCRKCVTRGIWVSNVVTHHSQPKTGGRVTYPECNADLRTDLLFRNRIQLKHHDNNGNRSLIEDIMSNMIDDDIIDYMHGVCIGVHKKILTDWVSAKLDKSRFTAVVKASISNYLVEIGEFIPNCFPRKTRSLSELVRWKATELRLDLLYIFPVAYKEFLNSKKYDHLMVLHVAIKLLVNKNNCKNYAEYAESLLKLYVGQCSALYGPEFISYNVHNLIHLSNDVRNHGCLDDISAFPFENKLQKLKNLIRKSGRPLQQIVNRLGEFEKAKSNESILLNCNGGVTDYKLSNPNSDGPLGSLIFGKQFKSLKTKKIYFSSSKPENTVYLFENDDVFCIDNILQSDENIQLIGRRFLKKEDIYKYPLPSSCISEYLVSELSETVECVQLNAVKCKAFRIPISLKSDRSFFVFPLVNHTL